MRSTANEQRIEYFMANAVQWIVAASCRSVLHMATML